MLAITVVALMMVGLVLSRKNGPQPVQTPVTNASAPVDEQKAVPDAKAQQITWYHSLPEALAEAKTRKTLVVADAYADWCGWCKKMDQDTFTNTTVQSRMRDFVPLKLDTDKEPELAQRYGITGLPTTLVLDASGTVVLSQAGYLPPTEYLQLLAQAAEKRDK